MVEGTQVEGRPVVEAPLTWRPGWFLLIAVAFQVPAVIASGARFAPGPLSVVILVYLAWYACWAIVHALNAKRWRVTFDGEVVEVRSRFGRWRFRPSDVGSVIIPTVAPTAILRLDHVERTAFGVAVPWPWPWRRPVTPSVEPAWFVWVGVSPAAVRPGGLRWLWARLSGGPTRPWSA